MKLKLLAGCAVACALAAGLSACASSTDPAKLIEAVAAAHATCTRDVSVHASVGALNPASGIDVTGQLHCQPEATPAAVTATSP